MQLTHLLLVLQPVMIPTLIHFLVAFRYLLVCFLCLLQLSQLPFLSWLWLISGGKKDPGTSFLLGPGWSPTARFLGRSSLTAGVLGCSSLAAGVLGRSSLTARVLGCSSTAEVLDCSISPPTEGVLGYSSTV